MPQRILSEYSSSLRFVWNAQEQHLSHETAFVWLSFGLIASSPFGNSMELDEK